MAAWMKNRSGRAWPLVAGRVHRRCRRRVRGADPPDGRPPPAPAPDACSTSARGEGQVASAWPPRSAPVVGVDPTVGPGVGRRPGRRRRYARASAERLPFPDAARSTRSSRAWCSSTSIAVDAAHRRGGPGPRPGGRFLFLPQPPAAADAGQRVDRRPHPRGAVLADRPLPAPTTRSKKCPPGSYLPFIHRPLSRYVHVIGARGC